MGTASNDLKVLAHAYADAKLARYGLNVSDVTRANPDKAFAQLAIAIDRLLQQQDERVTQLRQALAGLEIMYLREGESWNDCFERVGEAFHAETGYLRPGKDCRLHDTEVREKAWVKWIAQKTTAARAALAAFE